ncbi:hypothetical protein [Sphingobium cupriresistens]|uniref:Uncharacterized protein n=1 Tax=Sphingobium cupriresistens TaxID=1132417 RepID=A0A8G2DZN3_9SPHN|nr:hypothetical protein [Sphingobium cupriresistens]RYM11014.1 hypothetical protein EWH12_09915 [Sphingobium cupriresistens]
MMIYRQNHAARGTQQPYVAPVERDADAVQEAAMLSRSRRPTLPPARQAKEWNYTAPVLMEVERWLKQHDLPASKFGRMAVGDPNLVADLRIGRDPSSKVVARLRAFMAKETVDGE